MSQDFQIYVCLYSAEKNVLTGLKNAKGYWFDKKALPTGKELNGASKHCLPGGGLKFKEQASAGAYRELFEQTGLTAGHLSVQKSVYETIPVLGMANNFGALFLQVSDENLKAYAASTNVLLNAAYAIDVPLAKASTPGEVLHDVHVASNEIRNCEVQSIDLAMQTFATEKSDYFTAILAVLTKRLVTFEQMVSIASFPVNPGHPVSSHAEVQGLFKMSGRAKRSFAVLQDSNDSAKDALDAILNTSTTAPSTTSVTALPLTSTGAIALPYAPILKSISVLESFISVFGASLMYQQKPVWNITEPGAAAEFTKAVANTRNKIMTDTLSAYIRIEETMNHDFHKSTTDADVHMEFLGTLFSSFAFPPDAMAELNGIMTNIVAKFTALKVSFSDTSETMDHFISFHSFEPVQGLDPTKYLEPKMRIFYLHIDQHSWTVSVGKSSVTHFDFSMNYIEIKASVDFERVAADTTKLNNYIVAASNKKLEDLAKATTEAIKDTRKKTNNNLNAFVSTHAANATMVVADDETSAIDELSTVGKGPGSPEPNEMSTLLVSMAGKAVVITDPISREYTVQDPKTKKVTTYVETFKLTEIRANGLKRNGNIEREVHIKNTKPGSSYILVQYEFGNPHDFAEYNKQQELFYKNALQGFMAIFPNNGLAKDCVPYQFNFAKHVVDATNPSVNANSFKPRP